MRKYTALSQSGVPGLRIFNASLAAVSPVGAGVSDRARSCAEENWVEGWAAVMDMTVGCDRLTSPGAEGGAAAHGGGGVTERW